MRDQTEAKQNWSVLGRIIFCICCILVSFFSASLAAGIAFLQFAVLEGQEYVHLMHRLVNGSTIIFFLILANLLVWITIYDATVGKNQSWSKNIRLILVFMLFNLLATNYYWNIQLLKAFKQLEIDEP